jgi:hypothetical protein
MDQLDALLDEQEGQPPAQAATLTAIQTALLAVGGEMPDFAIASPEEREAIVCQLEQVRAIENAARSRRRALEFAIVRAAQKLEARELRSSDAAVRIEPPDRGYATKDVTLRHELMALVPKGDLTRAEVDAAVPETISAKADHRKVNALLKRGGRVREVIEANRTKKEADLTYAKVTIHRAGGVK